MIIKGQISTHFFVRRCLVDAPKSLSPIVLDIHKRVCKYSFPHSTLSMRALVLGLAVTSVTLLANFTHEKHANEAHHARNDRRDRNDDDYVVRTGVPRRCRIFWSRSLRRVLFWVDEADDVRNVKVFHLRNLQRWREAIQRVSLRSHYLSQVGDHVQTTASYGRYLP